MDICQFCEQCLICLSSLGKAIDDKEKKSTIPKVIFGHSIDNRLKINAHAKKPTVLSKVRSLDFLKRFQRNPILTIQSSFWYHINLIAHEERNGVQYLFYKVYQCPKLNGLIYTMRIYYVAKRHFSITTG